MKKLNNLIILILISISFSNAFANTPKSSIANAAGGAGVATVEVGESSFMNPATLTHLKGRYFYSSLQHRLYAISLTENDKESAGPGAFSYFADKDLQFFSLSLADFVYENIAFGISATYWQAEFDPQHKRTTNINANAGLIWTPIKDFGIGFAAENMLDSPDEFKLNGRLIPTSRVGFNYVYQEWFRWRLDFVTQTNNNWKNWIPQTGIESYMSKFFILRAGVSKPTGLKESWSAGFGFDLPRFKIDYATIWHANGGKEQRHSVDLSVPF